MSVNITRVEDQVVLTNGRGEVIERMSAEEALLRASDLTSEADHILKATAELEKDGN